MPRGPCQHPGRPPNFAAQRRGRVLRAKRHPPERHLARRQRLQAPRKELQRLGADIFELRRPEPFVRLRRAQQNGMLVDRRARDGIARDRIQRFEFKLRHVPMRAQSAA